MRCLAMLVAAALLGSAPLAAGTEHWQAVEAAIADPRRPASDAALDPGRQPGAMLTWLRVGPGQRVLDVVAGGGYYTRLVAPLVGPEGQVFAHTTSGLMAQEGMAARWSALKAAYPAVRLILGVPGTFPLPERLDRVLFHLTLHDLWWESAEYRIPRMDPDLFLKQLHASVVPGGLVLIVDHRARAGAEPRAETAARHRIDPAVVRAAMERAGFVLEAESDLLAVPADDLSKLVYDPTVRGKTDRFAMLWRRP